MPKLRQSQEERADLKLKSSITGNLLLQRGSMCIKDLAPVIGVKTCTAYDRIDRPGLFRLSELRRMFHTLRFTDEEILAVFGREVKKC